MFSFPGRDQNHKQGNGAPLSLHHHLKEASKQKKKTTIDIDVGCSEEMNESIQSTKLLLWYGDRTMWRLLTQTKL